MVRVGARTYRRPSRNMATEAPSAWRARYLTPTMSKPVVHVFELTRGGDSTPVRRRYSELRRIAATLRSHASYFPPKRFVLPASSAFLWSRGEQLEYWLNSVLSDARCAPYVVRALNLPADTPASPPLTLRPQPQPRPRSPTASLPPTSGQAAPFLPMVRELLLYWVLPLVLSWALGRVAGAPTLATACCVLGLLPSALSAIGRVASASALPPPPPPPPAPGLKYDGSFIAFNPW